MSHLELLEKTVQLERLLKAKIEKVVIELNLKLEQLIRRFF